MWHALKKVPCVCVIMLWIGPVEIKNVLAVWSVVLSRKGWKLGPGF